jgi:hypothetical protein
MSAGWPILTEPACDCWPAMWSAGRQRRACLLKSSFRVAPGILVAFQILLRYAMRVNQARPRQSGPELVSDPCGLRLRHA